ncbi:roadblock/LC7 domain-containing protein [Streptomyces sp. MI02-7b]|uniref:roadblock/LC7 domain-containing protein n=1 Tax=Streptomyces sp. MI02-7b TaxID=462941 RepID=UPI0029A765B2|nr:roadblock/LC7 domain-containing protein [Streptomyces sp. MI02-7b]MDX3075822.1 roadblock/LC7 domain-containing protein [Streptomyces sp. MI02-7b]
MSTRPDVSWILDDLVAVPHGRNAVLLSADGLQVAASAGVDRDLADQVAALASGMQALSRNGAGFVGDEQTPWQLTMVHYKFGFLFVIAAGAGSFLVTSAGRDVDVEGFSHRMTKAVDRLGEQLAVAPRQPAEPA